MQEGNNKELELSDLKSQNDTEEFIRNHCIQPEKISFHIYFNQKVREKGIELNQVIKSSMINRNYIYNITNGRKLRPGRDKILALCIGAHMDIDEINRGLEISDHCPLCPCRERDVRIASMVNNNKFDVLTINLELESKGLEPLDI